jgi:flagellar hook assembly protein FlgD
MVITQHLRQEGPIASNIHFRVPEAGRYRVCFRTPRSDTYEVAVVDASGAVVRTLAADAPLAGETDPDDKRDAHCFDWDGLDDAAAPVPAGVYRLKVSLTEADRSGISGERLKIREPVGS